jgi:isopenicillin-N N-acyltransferase-like protein
MPDLVIGSRRASPGRALRATGLLVALGATALVVAWFIYRRSVAYDVPDGEPVSAPIEVEQVDGVGVGLRWSEARLTHVGGLTVVRAAGEPFAIGAAHGRLLGPRLPATLAGFGPSIDALAGDGGWFGFTQAMRKDWRLRFVDDGITDRHRRGLAGLVRGAAQSGVDRSYQEVLRTATVLDIGQPSATTAEVQTRNLARALTVVAPQAGAATDRLWVGRSFALPGLVDGGDGLGAPVLFIVKPTGRQAWAGVGWPGLTGVVTGVNAAGLAIMVHPTRTRDVRASRSAVPIALIAREILEECTDLDAAIKKLEATPTLGAAAFVIVDGARGRWAVVDRSPTRVGVRRAPASRAVGDVLVSGAFADDPENDRQLRTAATVARAARAERLAAIPPADAAAVATLLRDRRGADEAVLPIGHRAALDDVAAAHVVVLDPASLQLWIGDGPGAGARLRGFDLRHELRGEGDRPVPPADLAPDPEADRGAAEQVRAARRELRAARGALNRGAPGRAAEAVARARALAPLLPEAWVVAGAVAQARGDRAGALAAWRRWFELGADDPGLAATLSSAVAP